MVIEFLLGHFRERERVAPTLSIIEEPQLPPIGPFNRVSGVIIRSQRLLPERYGDAIWHNTIAICAIDTSAPHEKHNGLCEAGMVSDLLERLPAIFDGTPLTPDRLRNALDTVLTAPGRNEWRRTAEFGLSIGGVPITG